MTFDEFREEGDACDDQNNWMDIGSCPKHGAMYGATCRFCRMEKELGIAIPHQAALEHDAVMGKIRAAQRVFET